MATPTPTTYSYSVETDLSGVTPDASRLHDEIDAEPTLTGLLSYVTTTGNSALEIIFSDVLDAAAKVTLDGIVADQPLKTAKWQKFTAIDANTAKLISNGFNFGGRQFSLSVQAQSTLIGLFTVRAEPMLTYPVKVNTRDNSDFLELNSVLEVTNFYLTAVGTYRAYLDGGSTLKDAVRAAASVAEMDAIEDRR